MSISAIMMHPLAAAAICSLLARICYSKHFRRRVAAIITVCSFAFFAGWASLCLLGLLLQTVASQWSTMILVAVSWKTMAMIWAKIGCYPSDVVPCLHWVAILLLCNPVSAIVCWPILETLPIMFAIKLGLCTTLTFLILSTMAIAYRGPD